MMCHKKTACNRMESRLQALLLLRYALLCSHTLWWFVHWW